MTARVQVGSILIEDRPGITGTLGIESEPYGGNWSVVRSLNGFDLDRKIRAHGWNVFFVAGEVRTTVFGAVGARTTRKALQRILARTSDKSFNCLEVTGIAAKRFVGVPYTSISATGGISNRVAACMTSSGGGRIRRMPSGLEADQAVQLRQHREIVLRCSR